MPDILFVNSPTRQSSVHMPYSFLYLAGYLYNRSSIFDYRGNKKDYFVELEKILKQNYFRFVGLSCYTPDYEIIMDLANFIKIVSPRSKIVVGGPHATISPLDFIYKDSFVDIVVIGEGEETCREILQLESSFGYYALSKIKGIAYLNEKNSVVVTGKRPLVEGLNLRPSYFPINYNKQVYMKPQKELIRRIYTRSAYIFPSRGCPKNCDFCSTNMIWGKSFRLRPVMDVVDEIRHLRDKWGIDFFYLADDTFGIDKKWTKEFLYLCERLNLPPFALQTRANNIHEFMCRDLKKAGCVQVDVGIEAGNDEMLNRINKKITLHDIWHARLSCSRNGLRFFGFVMINLPNETKNDVEDLKKLVKELKPHGVEVSICTPYPGTKLYADRCLGLEKISCSDYIEKRGSNPKFRMAYHNLDLDKLARKLQRKFKAQPMFERMWPMSLLYWKTIIRSKNRKDYVKAWLKDLPHTFIKWWVKRLHIDEVIKNAL